MADDEPVDLRDITKLVWPFPPAVIERNPSGGGNYVAHPIVEQRLIDVLGRPPRTRMVEVVRGWVAPERGTDKPGDSDRKRYGKPELLNAVVGVVLHMEIVIDGEVCWAEEIGDCEDPHNWKTDGQRLKDAFSDAYKRCAMRLGVGLHLWIKEPKKKFFVHHKLRQQDEGGGENEPTGDEVPDTDPIEDEVEAPGTVADHVAPVDAIGPEADDSGPTASSQPPSEPDPPPSPPDASAAPDRAEGIDWVQEARSLKLSQPIAMTAAKEVAEQLGFEPPRTLQHIAPELEAPLMARLTELADAKQRADAATAPG